MATPTASLPVASTPQPEPEAVLRAVWGHASFRPGQREVVGEVLSRRDCLAVMPTGAGKSVTFQLPARVAAMCVLVISPLLALMRDQVAGASARGLRATWVDSTLSRSERDTRLEGVRGGAWELVYVSPEGLPGVVGDVRGHIGLIAVDEAHCISEWGHDFRPAYREIGRARELLGDVPILAVTATATARVAADIVRSLALKDPYVWRGSFFRPNLCLAARAKDRLTDARRTVLQAVDAHDGASGIVYCLSRRDAGALATYLRAHGRTAAPYHAGMDPGVREQVQAAFSSGEVATVVATVAFGMGIDKADVRYVVHADLPGSVEAYAQEIGRAGRDGRSSDCLLLYSWSDVRRRLAMTSGLAGERRVDVRGRLLDLYRFARGETCRHRCLCAHFGEDSGPCRGACDACGGRSAEQMLASQELPLRLIEWDDRPERSIS
ncbi:MAG: RecQ family ATP-dependent DNA helicase [Coriobacteriia bacterium]|nr:RecQ family ATP-dependent DNA helicase [Coriobacteriia bacterium]